LEAKDAADDVREIWLNDAESSNVVTCPKCESADILAAPNHERGDGPVECGDCGHRFHSAILGTNPKVEAGTRADDITDQEHADNIQAVREHQRVADAMAHQAHLEVTHTARRVLHDKVVEHLRDLGPGRKPETGPLAALLVIMADAHAWESVDLKAMAQAHDAIMAALPADDGLQCRAVGCTNPKAAGSPFCCSPACSVHK
jgi:Zn ribbon nucleic-acid-binding protein